MSHLARLASLVFIFLLPTFLFAGTQPHINVYTWAEEIPSSILAQFEKETGIHVTYSTFNNNEMMYAKLRANNQGYDIIEPSSYYVDRLRRLNLLEKLDKSQLTNSKYLDPNFMNQAYDPHSDYSVPFIWGATGIFVNTAYFPKLSINTWSDLLEKKYTNQLMILDDPREAFSIALIMLGYSINDTNKDHIKQAYFKLRELMPNIRLFNSDAVISILIDEDASVGMAWNGDLYKAQNENSRLAFIFPKTHFEIWVDNFAILKNAPHRKEAYQFLNFLLRPDIAKEISLRINYSTANLAAKNLLPDAIKNNSTLYPSRDVLQYGEFETDIGDDTFALIERYWEQLKMGA